MMLLCFSIDNWISVGGILLAVATFIGERYYTMRSVKQSTKENWFLTIIVQPKLEDINKYYNDLIGKVDEIKNELKNKSNIQNHNDYIADKAQAQNKLKEHRNDFFENFITLIQSFDKKLALSIQNKLIELDDCCTKIVDNENTNDYHRYILQNKSELLALLYQNLAKEKYGIIKKNSVQNKTS